MGAPTAKPTCSRRALLRWTTAAGATVAALGRLRGGLAAPISAWLPGRSMTVFVFDPAGADGGGCTCKACLRHAEHKRFASRALAEARRAHPGCTCAIRALPVSRAEFNELFGSPGSDAFAAERDLRAPR